MAKIKVGHVVLNAAISILVAFLLQRQAWALTHNTTWFTSAQYHDIALCQL